MKNHASPNVKNCEDIQKTLLSYMTHELSNAPAELVSRHLRKCKGCQAEAAEIRATLQLLQQESCEEHRWPRRLSDEHRRRLAWTMDHPVLDWLCARHVAVSILAALLVVLAVFGLAWHAAGIRRETRGQETVYPVTIGRPPLTRSGQAPQKPTSEDALGLEEKP